MGESQTDMNFKTLLLVFALIACTIQAKVSKAKVSDKRRLGIPSWAKNALKGAAVTIVNTVIDCIADELKKRGLAFINKIPGLKMVGGKLAGKAFDTLEAKLKDMVDKAVTGAINKLRRRRRMGLFGGLKKAVSHVAHKAASAAKGVAKAAGNAAKGAVKAVGNAAKGAANMAKAAASVAGKAADAVHAAAVKLDGLTGGKLSAAMCAIVCPALAKAMEYALDAALKFIGWPGEAPACLITAIKNGCVAAVKAGFKKFRMLRNLRRLRKFISIHY